VGLRATSARLPGRPWDPTMVMAGNRAREVCPVLRKRLPDGRWPLETVYSTDRPLIANLLREIEPVGAPGKWVTLTCLLMLKRCAGPVRGIEAGEVLAPPTLEPPDRFTPYPWPYDPADEKSTRDEWEALPGMLAVLEALLGFAHEHGLQVGWHSGLAMGTESCREWYCSRPKLVPARTIKVAFPVARTVFVAPRGLFTAEGVCERLGVPARHEYAGRLRPGSWVEKALWRVRVDPWTERWDTVGVAMADASQTGPVLQIMAEALTAARQSPDGVR